MCFLTTKVFVTFFLAMLTDFCVPLMTIIVLYGLILRQATRTNQLNTLFSMTAIRMKRNVQVFKKIVVFVLIMSVGELPYLSTVLVNRFAAAPRSLYPMSILFISFSTVLESLVCLLTNKQVKKFFFTKMKCQARRTTRCTAYQLWARRWTWCQNISKRRAFLSAISSVENERHARDTPRSPSQIRLSSVFICKERRNLIRSRLTHGRLSSSHQEFTNKATFDELTEFWRERAEQRLVCWDSASLPLKFMWWVRWANACRRCSFRKEFFSESYWLLLNALSNVNSDWNSSCSIVPLEFWSNSRSKVERKTNSLISAALFAKTGAIKSVNCSNFMLNNSENRSKWQEDYNDGWGRQGLLFERMSFCPSRYCFSVMRKRKLWHGLAWNQQNSTRWGKQRDISDWCTWRRYLWPTFDHPFSNGFDIFGIFIDQFCVEQRRALL